MELLDANFKAEQEKRRREEALANATGIRVLQSIVAAVPVRLMKRDLLFIAEQLLPLLDEKRLEMAARNRSIKAKEGESVAKLLTAFVRTIGKLIIEAVILLSARSQADGGNTLRAAAQVYGSIQTPWLSKSSRNSLRRTRRGRPQSRNRSQQRSRNEPHNKS
jgi:ParB family chromosome partitioning protein